MFTNRQEAGLQLARRLKKRALRDPVVLAIPRGGVVTGAALARELGAELDVVLARKLPAPGQPELAIGAIGEDGEICLNENACGLLGLDAEYVQQQRAHQLAEIARRKELFRAAHPAASLHGRSVILTDDGIATGSTIIASLHVVNRQQPHEVIVAVPVAPPDRLAQIRKLCSDVVCLQEPPSFRAVGQFYRDFAQVGDEEVVELLRAQEPVAS
jgi:hypothetical protein